MDIGTKFKIIDLPCKMMFGTCSVSPYEPVVNTAPTKIPVKHK